MSYSDIYLQDHELNYWINGFNPPLHHQHFYNEFFPFKELNLKKVIEIGCGGSPITDYNQITPELTLVDPLLDKLITHDKFKHLTQHKIFSNSILEFEETTKYDYIVCLNVIDHFNDPEFDFIDKFYNILGENGKLWLYYDVRSTDRHDHLSIDSDKLLSKLEIFFSIEKIDKNINPIHMGPFTDSSIRLIAVKK